MASAYVTTGGKPYIVEDRPMISRSSGDRGELKSEAMTFPFFLLTLMITILGPVKITHIIQPGSDETGCLTCFYAPPDHPILAKCPCFDFPEYIVNEMRASQ